MIETNAQNAMMSPGIQGNPYQLASVSWGDLRVNASIVDYMSGYKDPRMAAYFTKSTFPAIRTSMSACARARLISTRPPWPPIRCPI